MPKELLITTDDFGMCHSVNQGIVDALTQGCCASTNFLAPAPWFHEAASLARVHGLDVGVHLCLGSDWDHLRWSPLTGSPRLRGADGRFPERPEALEALGATDEDIYGELRAQVLLVRRLYGEPTHLDAHMIGGRGPTPFLARVQAVIRSVADEFGLAFTYERDPAGQELVHFRAEMCMTLRDEAEILKAMFQWTGPGRYHVYGHAARASEELDALASAGHPAQRWTSACRAQDRALLMSPDFRAAMEGLGFDLVERGRVRSYFRDLYHAGRRGRKN